VNKPIGRFGTTLLLLVFLVFVIAVLSNGNYGATSSFSADQLGMQQQGVQRLQVQRLKVSPNQDLPPEGTSVILVEFHQGDPDWGIIRDENGNNYRVDCIDMQEGIKDPVVGDNYVLRDGIFIPISSEVKITETPTELPTLTPTETPSPSPTPTPLPTSFSGKVKYYLNQALGIAIYLAVLFGLVRGWIWIRRKYG
jgi:hypothetical protein